MEGKVSPIGGVSPGSLRGVNWLGARKRTKRYSLWFNPAERLLTRGKRKNVKKEYGIEGTVGTYHLNSRLYIAFGSR